MDCMRSVPRHSLRTASRLRRARRRRRMLPATEGQPGNDRRAAAPSQAHEGTYADINVTKRIFAETHRGAHGDRGSRRQPAFHAGAVATVSSDSEPAPPKRLSGRAEAATLSPPLQSSVQSSTRRGDLDLSPNLHKAGQSKHTPGSGSC